MDWIKIHLAQCECNPLVSNVGALDAEVSKELRPAPSTFPLRGSVGGREGGSGNGCNRDRSGCWWRVRATIKTTFVNYGSVTPRLAYAHKQ